MPFAEHFMVSGVTLAAQTATLPASININCGFQPTKVMITNETQYGQTGTGNENIQTMSWDSVYPTQTKIVYINAAGTATLPGVVTSNAISLYSGANAAPGTDSYTVGPSISGTVITKASPAVCTAASHGLQTGDLVQMTNNAVMTQLSGMLFNITVSDANTFTIPINTNTANFTQETSFVIRKVTVPPYYYPNRAQITGISAANPAVITTSTNHGFTVGQQVRIICPTKFGMTQINNKMAIISAVTATTITLGGILSIDSSAYTAFAWPATTSVPFSPALVVPVGSGPTPTTFLPSVQYNYDTLDDAMTNQSFQGFTIGTGLLVASAADTIGITASDVLSWTAWRGDV